jgi:HlyD family secretion protein
MDLGKTLRLSLQNMWVWLIFLALLGAGALLVSRFWVTSPRAATPTQTALPQQVKVTALGRLEPEGEVIKVGGPTGERIARLTVKEGDFVRQGRILAYLESYDERKAERDYAASQFTEAQAKLQAETQYGNAQIQEAQTRLKQVDQPELFEIQAQQATIRQLEAELSLAQINLARSQNLRQEGAVSQQNLDQQIAQTRQAEERLNNAKADLIRLQVSRSSNLQNAAAQVQSQTASMRRSQAQVEVESARRNLQLAEAKLARTIIRAPQDGEILKIITHTGEAIGMAGSSNSTSILDMGNTRQMFVVAEVYESDIKQVRLGQKAMITSRNGAFDQTLTGTVHHIGSQIFKNNILDDDPAANADARIVEVKIRLDDSKPVVQLTNLQVDVQIDVR